MISGLNTNTQNQYKQALIQKNYNEIYAHELAHQRAGGSLAGGIVIERNAEGIPVSGHVPIKMPVLDKSNQRCQYRNCLCNGAFRSVISGLQCCKPSPQH